MGSVCFCRLFFDVADLHFERVLVRSLLTRSLLSADHVLEKVQWAVDKMSMRDVCFCFPTWLYEQFVRSLISLTNAYTGRGTHTKFH